MCWCLYRLNVKNICGLIRRPRAVRCLRLFMLDRLILFQCPIQVAVMRLFILDRSCLIFWFCSSVPGSSLPEIVHIRSFVSQSPCAGVLTVLMLRISVDSFAFDLGYRFVSQSPCARQGVPDGNRYCGTPWSCRFGLFLLPCIQLNVKTYSRSNLCYRFVS